MIDITNLSKYKTIYLLRRDNHDAISIEDCPVVYINKTYIYYHQCGDDALGVWYLSSIKSFQDAVNLVLSLPFSHAVATLEPPPEGFYDKQKDLRREYEKRKLLCDLARIKNEIEEKEKKIAEIKVKMEKYNEEPKET